MLRFDVVSLFAPMFEALTGHGITGRAFKNGLASLNCWSPRDQVTDAYRRIDDRPFGGGPGMVMLAQPLADCMNAISQALSAKGPVVLLSPQGKPLGQPDVLRYSQLDQVTLICGRYEGIDQRFIDRYVTEEVCVADVVVSGGELPAMILMDAVVRWLPGVLNDEQSALQDSFATGLLDCPHYSRPPVFEGLEVPPVLLSGNHSLIAQWRLEQAQRITAARRPDLLKSVPTAGCSPLDLTTESTRNSKGG
jgi:tRNA (guanine37-N1)-methyltransferase